MDTRQVYHHERDGIEDGAGEVVRDTINAPGHTLATATSNPAAALEAAEREGVKTVRFCLRVRKRGQLCVLGLEVASRWGTREGAAAGRGKRRETVGRE
jgi:hypothetical protein